MEWEFEEGKGGGSFVSGIGNGDMREPVPPFLGGDYRGGIFQQLQTMARNRSNRHLEIRRKLRRNATLPERLLWSKVRNNQLGFAFRRQHSIGPYIVDFYCPMARLIVEVDGDSHVTSEAELRDSERDEYLWDLGYEVIRFSTEDVKEALDGVCMKIRERCEERTESIPPL
jgi:very-short-patch-repair endonuclease